MSYSDNMSETGQLGQIGHCWAALKEEPFLYDYFIREDIFALRKPKRLFLQGTAELSHNKNYLSSPCIV